MSLLSNRIFASVLALGLASSAALAAKTFTVDPVHSNLVFKVQHLGVSNNWGRVNDPTGSFTIGDDGLPSFNIEAKTAAIDTANAQRDDHLRGPDWFDAKQFPTMSFKSTSAKKIDDNTFEVVGDFTLKGVTKPITVELKKVGEGKDPWGKYRAGYETSFTIKRSDYGVAAMPGGIGEDVTIWVNIEGVQE
ncbi:MAG TPA: YceI family protein [Tepidisphaeraceae bacterium]|jgi:polyisoprenoid-binding protein YceI|nr:YceI family protein [Tepidisphaeraceae bacterium]